MASSSRKQLSRFKGRKRFQLEDGEQTFHPLQSKSTNIPEAHAPISSIEPPLKKRRRTTTHKKDSPKGSLFKNENVSIRLVDSHDVGNNNKNRACSEEAPLLLSSHRRLNNKISNVENLGEAMEDRSVQLDDFDQPPDSTSTPLLASPSLHVGSFDSAQLVDPIRPSPVVYNPQGYPVQSPPYAYPMAPNVPSVYIRGYESPLKGRGALFPYFSPMFMSPVHMDAYGWPVLPHAYAQPGGHFPQQYPRSQKSSHDSSASYKSSGGEATYRSSSDGN